MSNTGDRNLFYEQLEQGTDAAPKKMEDNICKQYTDEIRKLYWSFRDSGFNEAQSFELVKSYVSNTMMENMMRNVLTGQRLVGELNDKTRRLKEQIDKDRKTIELIW